MGIQKFKILSGGEKIATLGLGTWKIGGGTTADYSQDDRAVEVIREAIELGYTHIDTAEMYGAGHTEELIGRAIRGFDRQDLFITSKVWDTHLRYDEVLQACTKSLKRLGTGYLDLYLIHWPNIHIPLRETFKALNELVRRGWVRHLGVSNFNLEQLKRAQLRSDYPIVTNQVPYNLYDRKYVAMGMLKYCQDNDVLLTAHSPIERGIVLDHPDLRKIAGDHDAAPAQVALNWLVRQPQVIAIPMSMNIDHLKANLGALELELREDEIKLLDHIDLPEDSLWPE
jgi:diketogulonate reductase-like aldo/keto reductase